VLYSLLLLLFARLTQSNHRHSFVQAVNKGKSFSAKAPAPASANKAGAAALGVSPSKLISRSKSAVNPSRGGRQAQADEGGLRPLPGKICRGLFCLGMHCVAFKSLSPYTLRTRRGVM
jgi:hypothetical protein